MPVGKPNTEADFWRNVEKTDDCWNWTGKLVDGYPSFSLRQQFPGYRASYLLHYGPIPLGAVIRHKCDNKRCVRPDHLLLGTVLDNTIDRGKPREERKARTIEEMMR